MGKPKIGNKRPNTGFPGKKISTNLRNLQIYQIKMQNI